MAWKFCATLVLILLLFWLAMMSCPAFDLSGTFLRSAKLISGDSLGRTGQIFGQREGVVSDRPMQFLQCVGLLGNQRST